MFAGNQKIESVEFVRICRILNAGSPASVHEVH
jgi:hypothetical protein